MNSMQNKQKGFTLIEVIITIVIAALAGVIFFTYLSGTVTKSAEPIFMTRDLAAVKMEMERYASRYIEYQKDGSQDAWDDFVDLVSSKIDHSFDGDDIGGLGTDFDVIRVTVTSGRQTLSSIFSQ